MPEIPERGPRVGARLSDISPRCARRPCALLIGATVLLTWYAGSGALSTEARAATVRTHTVIMEGTTFSPPVLVVHQADTVVWANRDPFPHTATAVDGSFDSRIIASGHSWKYVARKPGEHPYGCTFHPTMKGTLKVE